MHISEIGAYGAVALSSIYVARNVSLAFMRKPSSVRINNSFNPSVDVIVPCYNESLTITRTVDRILQSDYPLNVIVVDDGSIDDTLDVVRSAFRSSSRVRIIGKTNGGKASAINTALGASTADIVVTVDADTLIDRSAVSYLVRNFSDANVAGVAGRVVVGNSGGMIGSAQFDEYTVMQEFEKVALQRVNAITVIPGAVGAFRRSVLKSLGGYDDSTLAEDSEITVRLAKRGHKVVYCGEAVAYTEAPANIGDYMRQRFRWGVGTFQVAMKHIDEVRHLSGIGFSLLWIILSSVVIPLLYPILDLCIVYLLLSGSYVLPLLFLVLSMVATAIPAKVSGYAMSDILVMNIRRIPMRYVSFVIQVFVLTAIISGGKYGWGKLNRTGAVHDRLIDR